MDIYRHQLLNSEYIVTKNHLSELNEKENFSNILNNLGFTSLDGSDVTTSIVSQSGYQNAFKWKYDLSNNYWFEGPRNNSMDNAVQALYFTKVHNPNGNIALIPYPILTGNFSTQGNQPIIFIPLKNNGFIFEAYRSNVPDAISFYNNLTPKFLTRKDHSSGTPWIGVDYVVGIADNTSNNRSFIYLFFTASNNDIYFFRNGQPGLTYIPYVDTSANLDYVNKNANVCTLVPYPIENQFLDNLYLATTIPGDNIEGEFFSFGGRNFLGIYQNLVVELPAN